MAEEKMMEEKTMEVLSENMIFNKRIHAAGTPLKDVQPVLAKIARARKLIKKIPVPVTDEIKEALKNA